jgi:O-antigen/teichoic acid export membrane protein
LSEAGAAGASVLRNTLATLGVRTIFQSFRLVTVLVTASALGVDGWGAYGLVVSQLDVVRALTNFGLDTAALRWMSLPGASSNRVLAKVLKIKAVLASAAFLLVLLHCASASAAEPNRFAPLILASGLFAQGVAGSLVSRVQAAHQAHRLLGAQTITGALQLALALLLAHRGAGILAYCALLAISDHLNAAAIWLFSRPLLVPDPAAPPARAAWPMLVEAVPLGLVELAVIAYGRLGVFLVERSAGVTALGQLYAAMKITDQVLIVAGALATSALPVLSRFAHDGRADEIGRALRRYGGALLVLSVAFAVGVHFTAEPLILRFRPQYAGAAAPLRVLAWAAVFMFQNCLLTTTLNALGRFRWVTATAVLNLGVYATVGLYLVPLHGALGAAETTFVTEGINTLVQLTLVTRLLQTRLAAAPAT